MNQHKAHMIPKSAYLMLPIMALAFYIAFIPHQGYPYPVHIDEWVHLAHSEAMLQAQDTTFIDPFFGRSTVGLSSNLEAGFHLFWGVFHQISGISWLAIFRYFPSIIFMLTMLSVYVLAQREGFGWEAALFACLIPTTVGILGPAFLVPMALGLLFIPLALFLVFNFRSGWSYFVLFLFTSFLLAMHAPSAIGMVVVLIPYILLNLRANFKHSLGITLAVIIPFLAPFPWIFSMLLPTAKGLLTPQPLPTYIDFPRIIKTYGYLPIGLCLLGTFLLAIRGGRKNYSLIFGLLALLVIVVAFFTFHYGLHIMYTRGLMYMMLMMSIVAGAGLAAVKNLSLPAKLTERVKVPLITQNVGKFLCLVLIGVTLAIGIPDRQDTPYYHMIDEEDYQAFVWIKENVDKDYEKAILDPWKATAFTAITGRNIYTRIHAFPEPSDEEAREFLQRGCSDTTFLREKGISIIYTRGECRNPDLIEVRENVYLLKEGK
ncbi:MAG: hypothetical protein ACE5LA_05525 [Dehalococcoidales bacterium]